MEEQQRANDKRDEPQDATPSPVGAQENPVSVPADEKKNPVRKELEEREKFRKERDSENQDH